ncbi:unnamed protein product, partial [Choristocarpus tenellus]
MVVRTPQCGVEARINGLSSQGGLGSEARRAIGARGRAGLLSSLRNLQSRNRVAGWPSDTAEGRGGGAVARMREGGTTLQEVALPVEGGREEQEGGEGDDNRILFYHKPALANTTTGDWPESIPIYLSCPGGGMALGLPLNGVWEGTEQESSFNEDLSYTILSWPEGHAKDAVELRRQQATFYVAMGFNVCFTLMLILLDNPDRGRVEPAGRPGSIPGPFEHLQRSGSAGGLDVFGLGGGGRESEEAQYLITVLAISLWGTGAVVRCSAGGIVIYIAACAVNLLVGLGSSASSVHACRYGLDIILLMVARSLLNWLTFSWATVSAIRGGACSAFCRRSQRR